MRGMGWDGMQAGRHSTHVYINIMIIYLLIQPLPLFPGLAWLGMAYMRICVCMYLEEFVAGEVLDGRHALLRHVRHGHHLNQISSNGEERG